MVELHPLSNTAARSHSRVILTQQTFLVAMPYMKNVLPLPVKLLDYIIPKLCVKSFIIHYIAV
jgi:hypothetical protein